MSRSIHFLALSASSCGLQILWSILLSSGTPFLVSLGFEGGSIALAWSIAPICGSFVQPWIGWLCDGRKQNLRERRLLLMGGAFATSVFLVGFSTARKQVTWITKAIDSSSLDETITGTSRMIAMIWFVLLNIAIQPLQMASRAVVIENNKTSDQAAASAWTSRMQGIGSILGFVLGIIPLLSEFSKICLVCSSILLATALLSASSAGKCSDTDSYSQFNKFGVDSARRDPIREIATLPKGIWQIFAVQFFAWMGWFPFRTYYTSWLQTAATTEEPRVSNSTKDVLALQARSARLGSTAGLYMSLATFATSCVLPTLTASWTRRMHKGGYGYKDCKASTKAMLRIWMASHIWVSLSMFLSGMTSSETGAVLIITSLGVSWAITTWIPFALMGMALSKQAEDYLGAGSSSHYRPLQTGTVVGLHNAAVSAPQILSALTCSIVSTASHDADQKTLFIFLSGGGWAAIAAFVLFMFFEDLVHLYNTNV